MMPDAAKPVRRVTITLARSPFSLAFGVRPTIVIEDRAQPSQWGTGTWQLPADRDTEISVFLHFRGLTWGRARLVLHPEDIGRLTYRCVWLRARITNE
ncbi:MAG: hypothetical protein ACOH1T_04485 [Microbacteriaceae bacterium]